MSPQAVVGAMVLDVLLHEVSKQVLCVLLAVQKTFDDLFCSGVVADCLHNNVGACGPQHAQHGLMRTLWFLV